MEVTLHHGGHGGHAGRDIRRFAEGLILGVLCVLCGGEVAAWAAVSDYIGKPVASVRFVIEGRDVNDPIFAEIVETAVDRPLSMVQVRESIAQLFGLGRFEDVAVEGTLDNGRVALLYVLTPVHPVSRIRFSFRTPVSGVDIGALRRAITDRYGAAPPVGRTTDMVRILSDSLAERGYLHTNVNPVVQLEHDPERAILSFDIDPGDRTKIGDVEIIGGPTLSPQEFLQRLGIARGAPFLREELTTRIERYVEERRRHGYYEAKVTPAITLADADRLANLTVTVDPGPLVRVVFAGDPLPADRRDELVPVAREGSVDEDLLEDSSNRIEEYLRGLGYRDAKAPYTRQTSDRELAVTFTIARGAQYRVSRLEISGNQAVPEAELAPLLRTKIGEPYSDNRLDADAAAIEDAYRRRGYAAVRAPSAADPQRSGNTAAPVPVIVRIVVNEGPRTVIDSVSIEGNEAIDTATLQSKVALAAGTPFLPAQLTVDRDAIQMVYNDIGYVNAIVTPRTAFSDNNSRVAVTYAVREGMQVFVDHVLIVGNVRTSTETIERELQLGPGDPFGLHALNESQRRLSALGLFRRVRLAELRHGDDTKRDLLVTVDEAPATTVGGGFGAEGRMRVVSGADTGGIAEQKFEVAPRMFVEYGRRNLFGRNRSINLYASVSLHLQNQNAFATGPRFTEYRLLSTYREPRLFDTAADGLLTASLEQQFRSSFSYRRNAITAQVARRLNRDWSVTGAYQIQRTELIETNVDPSLGPLIARLFSPEPLRLSSFGSSLIRDTRDDTVSPTTGAYLSASAQLAALAIGSEVGYVKSFFTAQKFHQLSGANGIVLAGSARLGLANEFDILNPIPEPERFFAGGDTTVRGFALDTLGVRHNPTDPLTDTIDPNGFPIGGNATVILNGELRVPLTGGLSVVSFFDTGNVFQRVSTMSVSDFRNAVGFGVRYKSPFGPLRVDLGFKTHVEAFPCNADNPAITCLESRPALHISFGQAF
jgi:outer membrane protein insertion porin family